MSSESGLFTAMSDWSYDEKTDNYKTDGIKCDIIWFKVNLKRLTSWYITFNTVEIKWP